jgi:ferredoxin-NADP reductase
MRVVFDHAETEVPGVITFWFKPERRVRFEPGQFAELRLPHPNADSRGDRREFSLTSSPDDPLVSITTNFASTKSSSFKRALQALRPGDTAGLAEPMGDFVLPKDTSIPLVFVAGGIGCAPYASMVKWLLRRNERRSITLIYTAAGPHDFAFDNLWRAYGLIVIPIVSRAQPDWHGLAGRLDADRLLDLISPRGNKLIYLAGPQPMIEPLFNSLIAAGAARSQLLLDYFTGY